MNPNDKTAQEKVVEQNESFLESSTNKETYPVEYQNTGWDDFVKDEQD
jgi:hypothetical protein